MSIAQAPPPVIQVSSPKEEIGLIQGIPPDSINEWYVALAMDRLELQYSFHYPIGVPGTRGSQIIDFVVWTGRGGIPVFVQGVYWHDIRHDPEATLKEAEAQRIFSNLPVLIWDYESDTKEKALRAVKTKVGVL